MSAVVVRQDDGQERTKEKDPLFPNLNRKPSLALDMDGVLADVHQFVYDLLPGNFDPAEQTTWDAPIEYFGREAFLDGFEAAWADHWPQIEPFEDDIAKTVAELRKFFDVHIVTTQADSESMMDGKKSWLFRQAVTFDEFVPVPHGKSKAELFYGLC